MSSAALHAPLAHQATEPQVLPTGAQTWLQWADRAPSMTEPHDISVYCLNADISLLMISISAITLSQQLCTHYWCHVLATNSTRVELAEFQSSDITGRQRLLISGILYWWGPQVYPQSNMSRITLDSDPTLIWCILRAIHMWADILQERIQWSMT